MTHAISRNAVVDAILARRSIRSGFASQSVPGDVLETIVSCGLAAPSSKNARPWRLHVVTDRALLAELADAARRDPGIEEYVPHDPTTGRPYPHWQSTVVESAEVLESVPCAIAIENRGVFSRGVDSLANAAPEALVGSLTAFGLESMGLGTALENMWLAAGSLGVGAAFLGDLAIVGWAARELLGLEGDLVGLLALGYSDEPPPPRREPPASTQPTSPVVWHVAPA